MAYNRYSSFIVGGEIKKVPFIKLEKKTSDKQDVYKIGITRFDLISDKYYKNPNFGWLIQIANPQLGSLEFKIEDNSIMVIPFPLESTLKNFEDEITKYITYYGI